MKVSQTLLFTVMFSVMVSSIATRRAFAQSNSTAEKVAAAGYPSDINPETLSRASKPKLEEFDNDEEKQAFEHAITKDPTIFNRFHATAHRLHLPVIADHYRESLYWMREKGPLDARLKVLVQMVATRESNNKIEYPASPKGISPEIIDIVKFKKDTTSLDEKDQVVIRLIREMIHEQKVSSKTYADGKRLFGERGLMTICSLTIYYNGNALLFRLFDKQLEPGQKPPYPIP